MVNFARDRTLVSVIKNGIQFYFMVLTVFRIKTFRVNFLSIHKLFNINTVLWVWLEMWPSLQNDSIKHNENARKNLIFFVLISRKSSSKWFTRVNTHEFGWLMQYYLSRSKLSGSKTLGIGLWDAPLPIKAIWKQCILRKPLN